MKTSNSIITRIAFCCCFLAFHTLAAQHCGWDFVKILIVELKDDSTGNVIDSLKLTIVDLNNNEYPSHDSLAFLFQNTPTLNKDSHLAHSNFF